VALQNRTYFFNVKENRMGDLYLNIVESKNRETGGFDRQSLVLFSDDLQEFLSGFDESLRVMEKAVREKRRSGRPGDKGGTPNRQERGRQDADREGPKNSGRTRRSESREKTPGGEQRTSDPRPENKGRRVVVRKARGAKK
jgi:hypothetical protein